MVRRHLKDKEFRFSIFPFRIVLILPSIGMSNIWDFGRVLGLDGGVYLSSANLGFTIEDSDKRGT